MGSRAPGKVYALPDADADGRADEVLTIAEGLDTPNGVAVLDGDLYVAEISRVIRFADVGSGTTDPPEPEVVRDDFPTDTYHGWKFIAFGPDRRLYIPVGVPCNVCIPDDPRQGTLMRMRLDGTELEVFADGLRNSVGFDWDPATGELWFTDNGRDWLGSSKPPDELNHAPRSGLDFGFPFYNADEPDPEYGDSPDAPGDYVPPALELEPHAAALGMRFYDGDMFPREYQGRIFIAEHGSWNSEVPRGYRVSMVTMRDGEPVGYETFADGFLDGRSAWGRPVDVLVMPDGALLVSDDRAGAVYRITYEEG